MTAALHHIRLELAREASAPEGDGGFGYDLVAPLTPEGRLDGDAFKRVADRLRVRRFAGGATDAVGVIVRGPGGRYVFDFEDGDADDEVGFRLDQEHFTPGEYVSIRDAGGEMRPYRVTLVMPLD